MLRLLFPFLLSEIEKYGFLKDFHYLYIICISRDSNKSDKGKITNIINKIIFSIYLTSSKVCQKIINYKLNIKR
jgi:hypothetical protein